LRFSREPLLVSLVLLSKSDVPASPKVWSEQKTATGYL
jgi:hypothetical protein